MNNILDELLKESDDIKDVLTKLNAIILDQDSNILNSAFIYEDNNTEVISGLLSSIDKFKEKFEIKKNIYLLLSKNSAFTNHDINKYSKIASIIADKIFFNELEYSHSFFQNTRCDYFPCHSDIHIENFNCLFCYCPLYSIKECGGAFNLLDNGIKDCMECLLPHQRNNYNYIINKLMEK